MIIMRRVLKYTALISITSFLMAGCGLKQSESDLEIEKESFVSIPSIDEYDPGMQQAHFISAPVFDAEKNGKTHDYEASFKMTVADTGAFFVFGDARGEYGELILCEIADRGEEASLMVKRFNEGISDNQFEDKTVSFLPSEDHVYNVNISVSGKELAASVNGEDLGTWDIPGFSLGCVGAYKERATSYAYLDDVKVTSNGEVLFEDDFDGNFDNNFYTYDYANEAISAFSPNHIKTEEINGNNSLRLSSGFILSETEAETAPLFRREFECDEKKLDKAYLYMTALGCFDVYINGKSVQDSFFDPGKMVFDTYMNYVSYDVTKLIDKENTLDINLFHGFFNRGNGYPESTCRWGDGFGVKGELVLVYKDGSVEVIPTNDDFKVSLNTRYRFNDVYHGEIIDDRYKNAEPEWSEVLVDSVNSMFINAQLIKKSIEPIRAIDTLEPVSVTEPVKGRFVYDFGKNIAGTISFDLKEISNELVDGQVVTFRYGELLNSENMENTDDELGCVWTLNLMTARTTDYYVSADEVEDETITFAHTYHGFRYVEVTGIDHEIPLQNIKALVLSTDMEETASFTCSSEIINQFYNSSKNSIRNNLMDNPTDCPQRDERLGWGGDAQITSLFTMYQFNSKAFYENYLMQMRYQQLKDGAFMDVAPYNSRFGGHNCWGDAAAVIAWNLYLQYGDVTVIEDNYDALCKWVDYLVESSDDYLRIAPGYGDHLSLQGTDAALSDTAWCARSVELVSKMASILGKEDDAKKYLDHSNKFKEKWQKTYIRDDWSVAAGILNAENETETAYSLGIEFGIFPDDIMEGAKERLKLLAEFSGYTFYPGYSGLAYFLPALADGGFNDICIKVLENQQAGGIAYPIAMGLTTNPEELYAFRSDDEYGNPYDDGKYRVEGSLDHAAYSGVSSFLFSHLLGIKPDEEKPGYEHFYIEPAYNSGLSFAEGSFDCVHGTISVNWNVADNKIEGEIPGGCSATLMLPDGSFQELAEGKFIINW